MSADVFLWNDKFGKRTEQLILEWDITGAKTVVTRPMGMPVLTAFDAIASQAVINTFLGTTDEFNYLAFDGTALGADSFGVIVNMAGQAATLLSVEMSSYGTYATAGSETEVRRASPAVAAGLTVSSNTNEAALGANGNIAFRMVFGNSPDFDGQTSGLLVARINWISK